MAFHISEAANLAIHSLAYLAVQQPSAPVAASRLAEHFGVSEAHLSKVLQRLAHAGLLRSARGPAGGFVLASEPESVTLREIYEAIDGRLTPRSHCLLGRRSCDLKTCLFGDLLQSIHQQAKQYLSATTLADLARR